MENEQTFLTYLDERISGTPPNTQEIIDLFVPFLHQLNDQHQQSKISPLKDIFEIKVVNGSLTFDEAKVEDSHEDISRLQALLSKPGSEDLIELIDGYTCWEFENFGFYDELSDVYIAGLMLASLALNINLRNKDDFKKFKESYSSLHSISNSIHPVIYESIKRMIKLQRQDRDADLDSIIYMLTHYQEQVIDEFDFEEDSKEKTPQEILSILQNRLYDFTRRNRLIYFKESRQALNLTNGSIPLALIPDKYNSDRVITWNEKLLKAIKGLTSYNLSDYLLLDNFPWLSKSLTAIRATSNKDLREYGFSQLRLCVAFLKWYNLKESKDEEIKSPLLLIPVSIKKKKGVRDSWVIAVQSSEAVVNPALKEHLYQVYGLDLPDTLDLEKQSLENFYEIIKTKIRKSEPNVVLDLIDSPNLPGIHKSNKRKLERYEKRTGKTVEKTEIVKPSQTITQTKQEPRENHQSLYWDFDISSTILGNFNYRKMTLVRDYKSIIAEGQMADSFQKIFTNKPKEDLPETQALESFNEVFHILPADPTQMAAIEHAKNNISYIIQGPPGTGKSQTISNLIADFAARDKRVLFVCEKRAALDVVYHRLGQSGLKKLCCLIHDSQDDKKEFIRDLKDCYETLSLEEDTSVTVKRQSIIEELNKVLTDINKFYSQLNTKLTPDQSVNDLISRTVNLFHGSSSDINSEHIPDVQVYDKNKLSVDEIFTRVNEELNNDSWYKTPFSILKKEILNEADPEGKVFDILNKLIPVFESLQSHISSAATDVQFDFEDSINLLKTASQISTLKDKAHLFLVDKKSSAASTVYKNIATLRGLKTKAENSQEKNVNWKEKLGPDETERAASIALNTEKSFFKFLMPSWWKLRKILNRDYDFSKHKLAPSWSEILKNLNEEHKAFARAETAEEKLCSDYNFTDLEKELDEIEVVREFLDDKKIDLSLENFENNSDVWESLTSLNEKWLSVEADFSKLFIRDISFDQSLKKLRELKNSSDNYHKAHPIIEELYKLPYELVNFIQKYDLNKKTLEYEILAKEVNKFINSKPDFKKFDFKKIETLRNKYNRLLKKLHQINARYILEKKSGIFSKHLKICNSPAAELSSEEKEFKKVYNRGRKELEHEFGKKMRYKSIRDLAAEDSGQVVKDLKPIWLMSPLSVSDTIPLDELEFDAVIFDEASQIVIEESIPTLYRSKQFIIVGDEKQLPPTSFFNVRSETNESLNILNADSLLTVSAMNVPSSLLGWHYRSKNEWLISFSNSAFYKRRLLTVPEIAHESQKRDKIELNSPTEARESYACLHDRPISFHFMKNGIYENRKNSTEAEYIAQLVHKYLEEDEEKTLGIVAFSEAQQNEIESSLEKLAESDSDFSEKYNKALERTHDGHYEGLFVKNLENVQGDERDIMILSICYGKNPEGKMRMNFGPINQKGGEKRLNVIVTRARRHVAVVSSIKGEWITNDYNEGALCFKRYLTFAEAISSGNAEQAEFLLNSMSQNESSKSSGKSIYHRFSKTLDIDLKKDNVGTSDFKVPLGLGQNAESQFDHALFDVAGAHTNAALEMAFMRPTLLENFGWSVSALSSKDVFLIPGKVTNEISENMNKLH